MDNENLLVIDAFNQIRQPQFKTSCPKIDCGEEIASQSYAAHHRRKSQRGNRVVVFSYNQLYLQLVLKAKEDVMKALELLDKNSSVV
jgi:hypothetical protein